ncbi:hypothetical protein EYF80_018012 [Liparis tanakae]|uniref:Uncharacterized protein n=1 Tax=Liparis tanakae TaxID=230148 RepID=A0A4Z2I242_9TELE|nr:hypothetical protein EYF80_018012 [Liparis tanakae]
MTEYLAKHRRIPPLANIPLDVRTKEEPPPTCFIPKQDSLWTYVEHKYIPPPDVGTFKRPDLDTVTDTDLNIDIKKTWADLDKEMIAEGFTAGGVLHFSCTHGVVYYVNFLFGTESARDHVDGLLSFSSFPAIYISDVAGQVSRHMNNSYSHS